MTNTLYAGDHDHSKPLVPLSGLLPPSAKLLVLPVVLKEGHLQQCWGVFAAGGVEDGTPGALGLLDGGTDGQGLSVS